MFKSPRETTIGSKIKINQLSDQLEVAMVQGQLETDLIKAYPNVVALLMDGPEVDSIQPFSQPVEVRGKQVIDLRSFRSKIERAHDDKILYDGAIGLLVKQAALIELWKDDPSYLFSLSDLPMFVYAHWLGEAISKRKSLNPADNLKVVTVCAWYYASLYLDPELLRGGQLSESELYGMANRIARVTYNTSEAVVDLIQRIGVISSSHDLVEALKDLGILRLRDLNVGLIYSWVSNSWFGNTSSAEMVGIAVEYPPYFVAMLHTAITENTYRRTSFNDIALRKRRGDDTRSFDVAFRSTLQTLKG